MISDWREEFKRLEGAYSDNTMRAYRYDVEAFVTWCAARSIEPFPAEPRTVCAFLEDEGETKATSTVQRRLYAIRKVHKLLHLPDPTLHEDINLTFRKVRRRKAARPRQAKGMTRPYLQTFLASQPDTPTGLRNRAMLSVGYDLLTRRSELVALTTDDVEFRDDGTLRVLIRRSKADPAGMGRVAFTSTRSAAMLAAWLDWRGDEIRPLFCPIYQGVPVDRALSASTVKRIIKQAAANTDLPADIVENFSGHSMRVGAAQDLLRAGHDTAAIMRAGGWKSIAVLARYLENAEHNPWA